MCAHRADAQEIQAKLISRIDGVSDGLPFRMLSDGVIFARALQFLADREVPVVVRVVDRAVSRVGRTGSGPGEYRDPATLSRYRDSLVVIEPISGRVSRFGVEKTSKGLTTVERPKGTFAELSAPASITSTGHFFVESPGDADEVESGKPFSQTIYWRESRSGRMKTLATVTQPVGVTWSVPVLIDGRPFRSAAQQPFVGRALWAMSKTGGGVVVLDQRADERSGLSSISIRFWNASGTITGRCEWSQQMRQLTPAVFDREIMRGFTDPRVTVRKDDVERATMRPKHAPAFDRMVYASDGAVWLRTSERYFGGADAYVRVRPECNSRNIVHFDDIVAVLDAKEGVVLASYSDDDSIEARLYSYRLPPT